MSSCERTFTGHTVILFLFVGAIAGAATVLLLAPDTRRESADRIRSLSHRLRKRAAATIGTAQENFSSTVSRGRAFLDEKRSAISSALGCREGAARAHKSPDPQ